MKITFPGCHSRDIFCSRWPACHRVLFCLPLPGRITRARMAFQPGEGGTGGGGVTAETQAVFPNQDLAGTQHWSPGSQKVACHWPNSSSSSSAKPFVSTCFPSVWSVISCGLGLPLRVKVPRG